MRSSPGRRLALTRAGIVLLGMALSLSGCGSGGGPERSRPVPRIDAVENGPFVGALDEQMARHHVPGLSIAVIDVAADGLAARIVPLDP